MKNICSKHPGRVTGPIARDEGGVYILVLIFVLSLGLTATAVYSFGVTSARAGSDRIRTDRARMAAESGFHYAVSTIWDQYLEQNSGVAGSPSDFRAYVETKFGLADTKEIALPAAGFPALDGARIQAARVMRTDNGSVTDLTITTTGEANGKQITLVGVYSVEGEDFEGFEFALLANNVNCIFCHAEFDSVERYSGKPYKRVKVSSLDTLLLREGSAASTIAGSLYALGTAVAKDGTPLDMGALPAGTLNSMEFDQDGLIKLGLFGEKTMTKLSPAGLDADGNPLPNENLYLQYPTDPNQQTDGAVPSEFPPVFPDENGNRVVDDAEFRLKAGEADGRVSGGTILGLAAGSAYTATTMPTAGNTSKIDAVYQGNLLLRGNDAAPLLVQGKLFVDGDVVISGVVKGNGSIYARGNIYVTGDLTYADGQDAFGNRTFGVATDGTPNKLGLAAGGNVLVGDYLTPKDGNIDDPADRTSGTPTTPTVAAVP